MTALTVRLPTSLHSSIKELVLKEGISVNQFIASAVGEKMAALKTVAYLYSEAAQGQRSDFERFLAAVPNMEPSPGDALPEGNRGQTTFFKSSLDQD